MNLVPFIDLLSMCICFLLMTAVWVEVGAIDVKQSVGSEAMPATPSTSIEIDLQFTSPTSMDLRVRQPDQSVSEGKVEGSTSEKMFEELRLQVAKLAPSKAELGQKVSAARVTTKAGVDYGELVGALDALRETGIVNVGIMPVKD